MTSVSYLTILVTLIYDLIVANISSNSNRLRIVTMKSTTESDVSIYQNMVTLYLLIKIKKVC